MSKVGIYSFDCEEVRVITETGILYYNLVNKSFSVEYDSGVSRTFVECPVKYRELFNTTMELVLDEMYDTEREFLKSEGVFKYNNENIEKYILDPIGNILFPLVEEIKIDYNPPRPSVLGTTLTQLYRDNSDKKFRYLPFIRIYNTKNFRDMLSTLIHEITHAYFQIILHQEQFIRDIETVEEVKNLNDYIRCITRERGEYEAQYVANIVQRELGIGVSNQDTFYCIQYMKWADYEDLTEEEKKYNLTDEKLEEAIEYLTNVFKDLKVNERPINYSLMQNRTLWGC